MELNDKLFRALILILSIAFLIKYYEGAQNGRYKFYTSDTLLVDSKTGKLYIISKEQQKWVLVDQIAKSK